MILDGQLPLPHEWLHSYRFKDTGVCVAVGNRERMKDLDTLTQSPLFHTSPVTSALFEVGFLPCVYNVLIPVHKDFGLLK